MKVRKGFVSNSSSSSFVVAFPRKPESVEDVKEMMFGKQEWHYDSIYERDVPTHPIAEKVFAKMGSIATGEEIFESIRHGWFGSWGLAGVLPGRAESWDDPEYKALRKAKLNEQEQERQRAIWDKHDKINDKRARAIADTFCGIHKSKYIVVMRFSDNDGEATEEHTGIFRRLEHIRTSYH